MPKLQQVGIPQQIVTDRLSNGHLVVHLRVEPLGRPTVAPLERLALTPRCKLSAIESAIVEVVGRHETLSGSRIAELAGYRYGPYLRAVLASLRRRGILGNAAPGYFLISGHTSVRTSVSADPAQ